MEGVAHELSYNYVAKHAKGATHLEIISCEATLGPPFWPVINVSYLTIWGRAWANEPLPSRGCKTDKATGQTCQFGSFLDGHQRHRAPSFYTR